MSKLNIGLNITNNPEKYKYFLTKIKKYLKDYLNKNYEVEGMDNLALEDLDNIGKTFGSTSYKFSDKEINKMKNDVWLKNHK